MKLCAARTLRFASHEAATPHPTTEAPSNSHAIRYIALAGLAIFSGTYCYSSSVPIRLDATKRLTGGLAVEGEQDAVTRAVADTAFSTRFDQIPGASRCDGVQIESNSICEDRFMLGKFPSPNSNSGPWLACAVFDGHSGSQTAELLTKELLPHVQTQLGKINWKSEAGVSDKVIHDAMIAGFTSLDDRIVKGCLDLPDSPAPLLQKIAKFLPAYSGSCALLSLYDPQSQSLHVACTGDSRAVLGRRTPDGTWEALPLSVDQTGSNEEEIKRLKREHPGEEDIAKNGRVLGMMVSRAFGDARWKWPLDFQERIRRKYYGPAPLAPRYPCKTPPYLTAEPVITTTKIDPSAPSFLILATDGMWDMLSNQQAVDLVGKWLDAQAGTGKDINGKLDKGPERGPFDFEQWWTGTSWNNDWKFAEDRTTVQDGNVATHLARNALGGNHTEMVDARLAFPPPLRRNVIDDMTIQVLLFNTPELEERGVRKREHKL